AGESRTVSIELSPDAFEFFDTSTNTMRVVPGEYEIMYGNSSDTPEANKLTVVLR
ncbi:fibronectin type III-like domain-contianing protein, partial [Paraprevotella clara]